MSSVSEVSSSLYVLLASCLCGLVPAALYHLFAERESLALIPGYWQRHWAAAAVSIQFRRLYCQLLFLIPVTNPPCRHITTVQRAVPTAQKEDFLSWRAAISSSKTEETE